MSRRSPEAAYRRGIKADALLQDRAAGCTCLNVRARIVKLADTPDNQITVTTGPHNADCVLYRQGSAVEDVPEGNVNRESPIPLALDGDAASRPDNTSGGLWLPT